MSKVTNWDDKAFVLEKINIDTDNLFYANDKLRDDEEVVLATISQNGPVLRYASDRLRSDVNFCIECVKKNPGSIAYFLEEVKEIFESHNNDLEKIQSIYAQQQSKANEALLAKLSTKDKLVNITKVFKRKLDV